jgi:ParB family chromosome partitioning protein
MVDRRLGRGLDFFLSRGTEDVGLEASGPAVEGQVQEIEISRFDPNPFQPRSEFDEAGLGELAASIRQSGVLQPVLARAVGDRFQIVAGERRWRAARKAGLERIPTLVRKIDDQGAAVLALVENLQRADLNPMEKARAFSRLQDVTKCDQEELARRVGLERPTVANFLRLLQLPESVQDYVGRGSLSMGQARALLGLDDPERIQLGAERCIRQRLSVRQVEEMVRGLKEQDPKDPSLDDSGKPKARKPKKDVWVQEIEDNLEAALGTPVDVRYGRRRSKIVLEIEGRDEFERIYALLKSIRGDA